MKRPERVNINGYEWSITYVPDKKWKKDDEREDGNSGETVVSSHSIFIRTLDGDERMDEMTIRDILLHEVLHACLGTSGHTYLHRFVKRRDQEELIVSGLTPALLAVLRTNAHLLEYLLDG